MLIIDLKNRRDQSNDRFRNSFGKRDNEFRNGRAQDRNNRPAPPKVDSIAGSEFI